MNTYIGIDLGTSTAKLLSVGKEGRILNSVTKGVHYCDFSDRERISYDTD